MFSSDDPEWLDSRGSIRVGKLSKEQQKIYYAAKEVGERGGRKNEVEQALKKAGLKPSDLSKDDLSLAMKSFQKAKISWGSGQF